MKADETVRKSMKPLHIMKSKYEKMFDPEHSLKQEAEAGIFDAAITRIVIVIGAWALLFTLDKITQLNMLSLTSTLTICFLLGSYILLELLLVVNQIKDLEFDADPVDLEH